jgi:ankyrin repeat protein
MFEDTIDEKIEALKRKDLEPIDQLDLAYYQIYSSAIGKDDPNRKLIVETTLQWMLCAYEEPRIEDLALVASIKPDGKALQPFPAARILAICSNFIVQSPSGTLRLAHLTVRPYLERRQTTDNAFSSSSTNLRAAMVCLRFLNPDQDPSLQKQHETNRAASERVHEYSKRYWTLHCRDAKNNDKAPMELDSLIKALYKNTPPSSLLYVAIRDGQLDAVQYGIATGADIEGRNILGNTPLQEAVRWRSLSVAMLLLASGAAIDSRNNVGDTALHIALSRGLVNFAEELLRREADTDIVNCHGFAALHTSVHFGDPQMVQLLLRFGANIDQRDARGNTALHYASMTNQQETVAILLGAGCQKQPKNADRETPLDMATHNQAAETQALFKIDRNRRRLQTDMLEFDTSGYCPRCDVTRWYRSALQGLSNSFYSSFQELSGSTQNGCPLCGVFVREIEAIGLGNEYLNTLKSGITVQMILCSSMPLHASGQDLLAISLGNSVRLELELSIDRGTFTLKRDVLTVTEFIDAEDNLGHIFSGRTLDTVSGSKACVKKWLTQCEHHHPDCQHDFDPAGFPTRLVCITHSGHIFLEEFTRDLSERPCQPKYVYLSFHRYPAFPDTITSLFFRQEKRLDAKKLPTRLKEAIKFVSLLGLQYLWIYELCINHDSSEDRNREGQRIGQYIKGATCVIYLPMAINVDGRLFENRLTHLLSYFAIRIVTENSGEERYLRVRRKLPRPQQSLAAAAVTAPRMQELALAVRSVYFTVDGLLLWNCATSLQSEGSCLIQAPILPVKIQPFAGSTIATATNNPLRYWYISAEVVSQSLFIRVTDTGMLKAMAAHCHAIESTLGVNGTRYLHGIWLDDLWRGLSWTPEWIRRVWPGHLANVPTWSWASIDTSISYKFAKSIHSSEVETGLDCRVLEISSKLTVSAISLPCASMEQWLNCECLFDFEDDEIDWLDHRSNTNFVAILLCKWYSDSSEAGSRWLGLVLKPGSGDKIGLYTRAGLFLGPRNDVPLTGWERREFHIV